MERNIREILSNFKTTGEIVEYRKIITGHINDSYYIKTNSTEHSGYFLQWVNNYIFKNVDGLMNNIATVTHHLAEKLASHPELSFKVLEIVPTVLNGRYYYETEGEYWRLYKFIDNAHSYDVVENTKIAYEGGKAFGLFMSMLADLPANRLLETIPSKTLLKVGVMGANDYYFSRNALTNGHLDMSCWYGFQEVIYKEQVFPAEISFDFLLSESSYVS